MKEVPVPESEVKIESGRGVVGRMREFLTTPASKIMAFGIAEKNRVTAEHEDRHVDAVNFWWEQCLISKHIIMGSRGLQTTGGVKGQIGNVGEQVGVKIMERAVAGSENYLDTHESFPGRDPLVARMGRFRGDLEMLKGNYEEAEKYLREGISLYEQMTDHNERFNILELSGFLAEAEVLNGELKEGVTRAIDTYSEYKKPEWEDIKAGDEHRWLVWKSGGVHKVLRAIFDKQVDRQVDPTDKASLIEMFVESESELAEMMQNGGKKRPEMRWDEFVSMRKVLHEKGWL